MGQQRALKERHQRLLTLMGLRDELFTSIPGARTRVLSLPLPLSEPPPAVIPGQLCLLLPGPVLPSKGSFVASAGEALSLASPSGLKAVCPVRSASPGAVPGEEQQLPGYPWARGAKGQDDARLSLLLPWPWPQTQAREMVAAVQTSW